MLRVAGSGVGGPHAQGLRVEAAPAIAETVLRVPVAGRVVVREADGGRQQVRAGPGSYKTKAEISRKLPETCQN